MLYSINISKNGETVSLPIEWDDLPEASKDYVIRYGLKQALNDAHASESTMPLAMALVNKRLDALKAGNPPKTRDGSGKDTWTREMENLAAAQLRSVGIKAKEAREAVEAHGFETVIRNLATATKRDPEAALQAAADAVDAKIRASKSAPADAAINLASLFAAPSPTEPTTPPQD